jgi:hypothetical protein
LHDVFAYFSPPAAGKNNIFFRGVRRELLGIEYNSRIKQLLEYAEKGAKKNEREL